MKGWVGLVGWPTADVWPTKWSSVQLAVRRMIGKVRRSKTSVLPLCYANQFGMLREKFPPYIRQRRITDINQNWYKESTSERKPTEKRGRRSRTWRHTRKIHALFVCWCIASLFDYPNGKTADFSVDMIRLMPVIRNVGFLPAGRRDRKSGIFSVLGWVVVTCNSAIQTIHRSAAHCNLNVDLHASLQPQGDRGRKTVTLP